MQNQSVLPQLKYALKWVIHRRLNEEMKSWALHLLMALINTLQLTELLKQPIILCFFCLILRLH